MTSPTGQGPWEPALRFWPRVISNQCQSTDRAIRRGSHLVGQHRTSWQPQNKADQLMDSRCINVNSAKSQCICNIGDVADALAVSRVISDTNHITHPQTPANVPTWTEWYAEARISSADLHNAFRAATTAQPWWSLSSECCNHSSYAGGCWSGDANLTVPSELRGITMANVARLQHTQGAFIIFGSECERRDWILKIRIDNIDNE